MSKNQQQNSFQNNNINGKNVKISLNNTINQNTPGVNYPQKSKSFSLITTFILICLSSQPTTLIKTIGIIFIVVLMTYNIYLTNTKWKKYNFNHLSFVFVTIFISVISIIALYTLPNIKSNIAVTTIFSRAKSIELALAELLSHSMNLVLNNIILVIYTLGVVALCIYTVLWPTRLTIDGKTPEQAFYPKVLLPLLVLCLVVFLNFYI